MEGVAPIMGDIITLTTINEEPRVLDTDLAEALGMARSRNIRVHLIEPNRIELERYGPLCSRTERTGGRPATAYYLNEEQALLVCMFSRTERAKDVREAVIRVFTAYRKGQLQPALPDFTNPAEAARAWALEYERSRELEEKNAAMRVVFDKAEHSVTRFIRTLGDHVHQNRVKAALGELGYLYRAGGPSVGAFTPPASAWSSSRATLGSSLRTCAGHSIWT